MDLDYLFQRAIAVAYADGALTDSEADALEAAWEARNS